MGWLAEQPNTIFIGQAVGCNGTGMSNTLKHVSIDKRIEFPVVEDMQMGMSIGMALDGSMIPISIFPRWNFMLLATNQLVNHLNNIPLMANDSYKPKIIIRVGIGAERPLHPQHQHVGDYSDVFKVMCPNINIVRLDDPKDIVPAYQKAYLESKQSTILVEWGDFYTEK